MSHDQKCVVIFPFVRRDLETATSIVAVVTSPDEQAVWTAAYEVAGDRERWLRLIEASETEIADERAEGSEGPDGSPDPEAIKVIPLADLVSRPRMTLVDLVSGTDRPSPPPGAERARV